MKQIFLVLSVTLIALLSNAQVISPDRSGEYCPGVNITFTVTIAGQSVQSVTPKALNVPPTVVQQPINISVSGGNLTFSFVGRFADYNNKQTFTVNYTNSSGQPATWDATYIKIKSLLTANSFSQIYPTPTSITAPRCQIQSFNISFPNVQYGNPWEAPPIGYGTVTNYEYLLPSGWSLNGVPSTGGWLAGNNNVMVTSDLASGVGGSIRIRPVNTQCAAGLQPGQEASVAIIRPEPPITISGSQGTICSGSATYSITGMPSGASVIWSLSNSTDASIVGCTTCQSVTVSRTTSTNTETVLTATVTDCAFTYTKYYRIILGTMTEPITIYGIPDNYQGCKNADFNVTASRSGNMVWSVIGGQILYGQGTTEIRVQLDNSPGTFYIGIAENNSCGLSTVLGTKQGTIIECDGGGGGSTTTRISPNPTTGQLIISIDDKKKGTLIKEIVIKNRMGRIFNRQKFVSGVTQHNFNVSNYPNDIYIIDVFDGSNWSSHKIIKQ
jgi:hypothetical protein